MLMVIFKAAVTTLIGLVMAIMLYVIHTSTDQEARIGLFLLTVLYVLSIFAIWG